MIKECAFERCVLYTNAHFIVLGHMSSYAVYAVLCNSIRLSVMKSTSYVLMLSLLYLIVFAVNIRNDKINEFAKNPKLTGKRI